MREKGKKGMARGKGRKTGRARRPQVSRFVLPRVHSTPSNALG